MAAKKEPGVTLRTTVPRDVYVEAQRIAAARGVTLAAVMRDAVLVLTASGDCICEAGDHSMCWLPGGKPDPACACCMRTIREIGALRAEQSTPSDQQLIQAVAAGPSDDRIVSQRVWAAVNVWMGTTGKTPDPLKNLSTRAELLAWAEANGFRKPE